MVLLFCRTKINFISNSAFLFQLASLGGLYNHCSFNSPLNQVYCPVGSIIKEFISIIIIPSVYLWHMLTLHLHESHLITLQSYILTIAKWYACIILLDPHRSQIR